MALLPIVALIYILAKDGLPHLSHVLLAASFFVSWVADSLTTYSERGEIEYGYIWVPIQLILAYAAARRGALYVPIFIYFGIDTVALVLFLNGQYGPNVMAYWLFYQSCRLTGILALSFLIIAPPRGKNLHVVCN